MQKKLVLQNIKYIKPISLRHVVSSVGSKRYEVDDYTPHIVRELRPKDFSMISDLDLHSRPCPNKYYALQTQGHFR